MSGLCYDTQHIAVDAEPLLSPGIAPGKKAGKTVVRLTECAVLSYRFLASRGRSSHDPEMYQNGVRLHRIPCPHAVARLDADALCAPTAIPYGLSISTESAKNIAAAAIAEAQKHNWKMAIAIVDTGGYLVYFEKMQDTQTGSVELAIEKARTAALFRRPTKVFQTASPLAARGSACYGSPAPFRLMAGCRSSWMAKCSGPSGSRGAAARRTGRWPQRAQRALAPSNSNHSLGRTVPGGREVP